MIRPESDIFIFITILLLLIGAMVSHQVAHHQTRREQTRLQLAEKDAQIRNIVDATLNGIIASFNPAACRMFGPEEKDVIGKNVSIIVSSPHDSYLQRYGSSGEAHIEVIASLKDGTTFPVGLFVTARQSGEHWQFMASCMISVREKQWRPSLLRWRPRMD